MTNLAHHGSWRVLGPNDGQDAQCGGREFDVLSLVRAGDLREWWLGWLPGFAGRMGPSRREKWVSHERRVD